MKPEQKRKNREKKKAAELRQKARKRDEKIETFRKQQLVQQQQLNRFPEEAEEVEYALPELPFSADDARFDDFKSVFNRLSIDADNVAEAGLDGETEGEEGEGKRSRAILRKQVQHDGLRNAANEETNAQNFGGIVGRGKTSIIQYYDRNGILRTKKTKKKLEVAALKSLTGRPDVVTEIDTTAPDPITLVFLKSYRNTVTVPDHWQNKRKVI